MRILTLTLKVQSNRYNMSSSYRMNKITDYLTLTTDACHEQLTLTQLKLTESQSSSLFYLSWQSEYMIPTSFLAHY
jgi:hypothetical protein